ncbi:MAG TPA: hypothetical protein VFL31_05190, partial [Nitrospiraceae bacterium]|nr:hypothetical protein [Nitrospiraceae bacterium]
MQSVQVPIACLCEITKIQRARSGAFLLALLLAGTMGCEEIASKLRRADLPDLGPPIPVSARLEFDPSLTDARAEYVDSCGAFQVVIIGDPLEDTLLQAAQQTFKTVYVGGAPADAKPDVEVRISLLQPRLRIRTDNVYDREPADLTLDAIAVFRDSSGKLLLELPINVSRQERLILEPTQHRCAYASIDRFVYETGVVLSTRFMREARTLLDPESQATAAGEAPSAQTGQTTAQGPAALSFKATILDENNNLILESGERVKVRVDLTNSGTGPAKGVSVNLTGTPLMISQFPSTTLSVGTLQPGESRSVEFSATLPQAVPAQRGELVVTITEASGTGVPAAQTLVAAMRPGGETGGGGKSAVTPYDDVDRVPAVSPGFQRPKTHLLTVGISAYRDHEIPARKYAKLDAEMVAAYFQSLGGVPATNVRLLQDQKALRPDIEEVLLDWLPPRVTAESVVIVYFAGQAMVAPSGETYLVPYEGRWNSASRLYPLKDLQAALGRLRTHLTLFIFDGSVSTIGGDTRARSKVPQWDIGGGSIVRLIGTTGLRNGLESEKLRHGLFTYYLLRGLKGEADANRDGEVTLGELTAFLGQTVPAAARSNFRQEQRPLIFPPIDPASKLASLTLTKPAAVAGSAGR